MTDSAWQRLTGLNVIESPLLPVGPTPKADARRIVRHGMVDVLAWLGEEVGPKPGDQTHRLVIGRDIHASAAAIGKMRDTPLTEDERREMESYFNTKYGA